MSGLIRGALNLIQGETSSSGSHPLIGAQVEVGSKRLRVDSIIAEGGYAVVFAAYDSANKWFALKRQLAKDNESVEAVIREIRILKELSGHPSILGFIAAAQMKIPSGGVEFMLLTELCTGGSVADLMKSTRLTTMHAIKIFHSATKAVCHMHNRRIPITHRDIKIENLLFDAGGNVKLCDFGSATTQIFSPNETWNVARRTQLEEEMQRHTTPMYRAPEILDTYQNFVVGPQQDIWALGCVLFYLCYHVHPFEDSAKLRILNVAYTIPSGFEEFRDILPIIESCLKVDPVSRPIARDLVERTEVLAVAMDVDLAQPVPNVDNGLLGKSQGQKQSVGGLTNVPPPRPPPPRSSAITDDVTEQASAVFGAIKGQGLSLLKNLKDRSTAVVQKVQSKLVPQEITWVTSRLCVVPQGKTTYDPIEDEEWMTKIVSADRLYGIFNMTSKSLRKIHHTEPIACKLTSVHPQVPPPVENILLVCSSVITFLRNRPGAAVVLFGSEVQCMVAAAAILLYCKLIGDAHDACDFVANKRRVVYRFSPSHIRILDLVKNLTSSASAVLLPMNRTMSLHSISLSVIPILAGVRSSLRPVIEIFQGGSKIWDSIRSRSSFLVSQSSLELDVGDIRLNGQVTILVFYCRSDLIDAAVKKLLFSLVFHTSLAGELLRFTRSELDVSQVEDSNIPTAFRIALGLRAVSQDDGVKTDSSPHYSNMLRAGSPELLVMDFEEQKQIMDWYSVSTEPSMSAEAYRSETSSEGSRPASDMKSDFFETLDWSQAKHEDLPSSKPRQSQQRPKQHQNANSSSIFETLSAEPIQLTQGLCTSRENCRHQHLPPNGLQAANAFEHQGSVAVEQIINPYPDQDHSDSNRETPILTALTPPQAPIPEFNLLDLDDSDQIIPPLSEESAPTTMADPFSDLLKDTWATSSVPTIHTTDNLLEDWSGLSNLLTPGAASSIHRNVSAPAFQPDSTINFDPFAEFLSQGASNSTSTQASAPNSGSTTPKPPRPNYSRYAFESLNANSSAKKKVSCDAFDDLLSSQGFTASSRNANLTLGDLRRAEEVKEMDPVAVRVSEWVEGKERNIRALLGSLNDVLWDGAEMWQQPRMADLLSASQVKRSYYKACLLVHPDKQIGTPHEKLARAIFTELNDAWNAFEQTGGHLL